MLFKILAFFALLGAYSLELAFATGPASSAGGNARVCFDDEKVAQQVKAAKFISNELILDQDKKTRITSIEILDLYEATLKRGFGVGVSPPIIPIQNGERPDEYASRILSRIEKVFPRFYRGLKEIRDSLNPEDLVTWPNGLNRIDDAKTAGIVDTDKCVVATIIAQVPRGMDLVSLSYDPRLFNHDKHATLSRGVGYLHEIVYRFTRRHFGAQDSDSARDIVGLMIKINTSFTKMRDVLKSYGYLLFESNPISSCEGKSDCFYHTELLSKIYADLSSRMDQMREAEIERQAATEIEVDLVKVHSSDYAKFKESYKCSNSRECLAIVARHCGTHDALKCVEEAKRKNGTVSYKIATASAFLLSREIIMRLPSNKIRFHDQAISYLYTSQAYRPLIEGFRKTWEGALKDLSYLPPTEVERVIQEVYVVLRSENLWTKTSQDSYVKKFRSEFKNYDPKLAIPHQE